MFIHSEAGGYIYFFQLLGITDKAVMNIYAQALL